MNPVSAPMLAWMAVGVLGAWTLRPAWLPAFLVAIGGAFLAWHDPYSLAALALVAAIARAAVVAGGHRAGVGAIAALALGMVAYKLAQAAPPPEGGMATPLVLLGFAFYGLRAIHYVAEHAKGTLPDHTGLEFAAYMAFLPTLAVGPIHRFGDFHRELHRRRLDGAMLSGGAERVAIGFAKVAVVAGFLDDRYVLPWLDRVDAPWQAVGIYLWSLHYGLDLYVQFSGYADVAIGFAAMLGIRVMENFRHPFAQPNIGAFWRSWHISLSSWCRDYVFTPLAAATRRPVVGALGGMIVLGLWHEASWRYLAWGAYHGLGIAAWQAFQGQRHRLPFLAHPAGRRAWLVVAWFLTFNFVVIGFAFTKDQGPVPRLEIDRQWRSWRAW